MRFELLINDEPFGLGLSPNNFLDTFQEESISLNYNIADVTDISKKNSSYSKTIQLPDTKNNRLVFTNIFNIENTSETTNDFDTNRKVKCWVLADSIIIFKGNLQLTNIVYDYENNRHLYEVIIYSDNDTLFKSIGDKLLSDLDLSRYDHSYNSDSIKKSWGLEGGNAEYTNGYFYPLIDYGFPLYKNTVNQTNPISFASFYPAVYTKIIFDQIFTEAGFSYDSNFLNSDNFTETIIPFNNKNFKYTLSILLSNGNQTFIAGKSATSSFTLSGGWDAKYVASLKFDTDIFDPNGFYNTTSHFYENFNPLGTQSINQNFTINFKFTTTNFKPNTVWVDSDDDIRIWCKRSMDINGNLNPSWGDNPTYDQIYNPSNQNYFRDILFNGGQGISLRNVVFVNGNATLTQLPNAPGGFSNWEIKGTVTTDFLIDQPLRQGEQVRFFATRFHYFPLVGPAFADFFVVPGGSVFSTIDANTALIDSFIQIKDILPTKVKQKDFLTSIFKMFNLYIEPSKELENHFIIEPRDQYYNRFLVAKDWSNKLDLTESINSEILSNLQKKTNLFTYKADKDIYNTNYTTTTNEIFGQFEFELDNDFLSGENRIEPIFSPTPIDELKPTGTNIYLPIIANLNNGNFVKADGMNIRILYRRLLLNNQFAIRISESLNFIPGLYPYAGPDDDPLNPNFTLNFGSISPFYEGYSQTLKNLVNIYYRNQITELNDKGSRLITANFNLDYNDINTFRFSDLIFCTIGGMSSWYRVNKIMDYDPITKKSTKVQLIKAYNYQLPDPTGATPSVEFCFVRTELTYTFQESIDFVNTIGAYANSIYPWLTFYNTYENVGYSFGPVSESIGITDLELWSQTAGIPNFTISYNTSEQILTIAWKINVPCETGPYQLFIVMSDAEDSLNNIQPLYSSVPVDCTCDNLNRISPYVEQGLRNVLSTNNVYVGVLNTSTSNKTAFPNVVMVGNNNSVESTGVVTIGDGNSSFGGNSLLVGQSNQITNRQSLVVGDTNIVNGQNSFVLGSSNDISTPQTFVMGIGNQMLNQSPSSFTYSTPGTTSVFGTFSQAGTQSMVVIGNDNISLTTTGFVYGSNNYLGVSVSNSFIFGNNNNLAFTQSGPSNSTINSSNIDGAILFGNNINIIGTSSQSFNNTFIIGNNITLTQSISDVTYLYTENIILSENGGFNPPFIISDAVSSTQIPTGQSIIKTITGYYNQNLSAGNLDIILNDFVDADILTDKTPIIVEANVRLEATIPGPTYECGVVTLFGVFTKNLGTFELVGTVDKVEKNNFSVLDKTSDLTDSGGDMILYLESSGSDQCNFYWDITFRYRYE
jgi:hypothetical protein